MINACNGFRAVALSAGKIGPDGMDIFCFTDMAFFTSSVVIKFDAPMGVGQ